MRSLGTLSLVAALALGACSGAAAEDATAAASGPTTSTPTVSSSSTVVPAPVAAASAARPRPAWLGTRVLPIGASGFGEVQPTPAELVDRRLETPEVLPAPVTDAFTVTVAPVPDDVLARSTWTADCPVTRDELRYVTLPFWGFDGRTHTGELLLHRTAVEPVLAGFAALYEQRFPIEEMRIVRADELDRPPTGDGNNTTAFVCRPMRGSRSWSEHAYGMAVDVNPFHNPYVTGEGIVLPELASAYLDRTWVRPGMLDATLVGGFTGTGWGWGGNWSSPLDLMHLSASGR